MNTAELISATGTIYDCITEGEERGLVLIRLAPEDAARLCAVLIEDPAAFTVQVTLHKVGSNE